MTARLHTLMQNAQSDDFGSTVCLTFHKVDKMRCGRLATCGQRQMK